MILQNCDQIHLQKIVLHDSFIQGCPKLFFIQACHGEEMVKAASSHSNMNEMTHDEIDREHDNYTYQPNIPVDADLLVLSASTKCKNFRFESV